MLFGKSKDRELSKEQVSKKEKVFKDLEAYCNLDTYAMKVILDKLKSKIKE